MFSATRHSTRARSLTRQFRERSTCGPHMTKCSSANFKLYGSHASRPEACGRDNAEGPVARDVSATCLGRRMQRESCLTLSYAVGANHLPTQQPLTRLGPLTLLLCPHLREYPQPLVRSSAAMAAQAGKAAASLDVPLHSAPILNTHRDAYTINGPYSEEPNPIHASDNNGGCYFSPSSSPARASRT